MNDKTPWSILIQDLLLAAPGVEALYVTSPEWTLWAVVEEHTDGVYEQLVAIEMKFDDTSSAPLDLRVTAHQGRPVASVVPDRAIEIFNRALIK